MPSLAPPSPPLPSLAACAPHVPTTPPHPPPPPTTPPTTPLPKAIGGLNTLSVRADGTIAADNTDWVGIRNLLTSALRRKGSPPAAELTALVLGGGGTARAACYALQQMGVGSLHVFNRSVEKAEALAAEFGGSVCQQLDAAALPRLELLVSCVPGTAQLTLPVDYLRSAGPIVLDAAYRPRQTPLLQDAAKAGCVTIEGIEMLFEQGCAQSEIWTSRPADRKEIAKGIAAFLDAQQFGPLPRLLLDELGQ